MVGGSTFRFKHFVVEQSECTMKVGTDGVLLGAWCRVDPGQDKAILDIGTGTGVIAMQLAQRTIFGRSMIDAVEIDEPSCRRAEENFNRSGWNDRLRVYNYAIQDFATERKDCTARYDHIVSNPPYFIDSLTSSDPSRTIARHSQSLSYDDLIKCCLKLLTPAGRVSLILPAGAETENMIATARRHDFVVSRRTEVHSTPQSGPKRTLLEFSRLGTPSEPGLPPHNTTSGIAVATVNAPELTSLVIQDAGSGTFSVEYRNLTCDFYLDF